MNKKKFAFICIAELFEFNIMPFDLTNAPATFQRLMDEVIDGVNWCLGSNYLDDLMNLDTVKNTENIYLKFSLESNNSSLVFFQIEVP
jgi:hypothetical protein